VVPILIALVLLAGMAGGWRLYRERQLDRKQQAAIAVARDTTLRASPPSSPAASMSTAEKSASPQSGPDTSTHAETDVTISAKPAETKAGTQLPATAPISLATGTSNVANPAGTPFELTVRPKNRAWVSIKSDGKFVVRGIIQPPDVKTIRATDQVVFWTGNAGAVAVSFNGKDVPLSGGENEERVLVFNSRGLLPPSASPRSATQ
jgi:hypothetical protein